MTKIDFHADDYALSEHSDNDILRLCKDGKLDSISIIPNLRIFESAAQRFLAAKKSFPKDVKVSVHLNVMEGKALSEPGAIPDLVDRQGYFNVSWGKIFLWSQNPFKRKTIRRQLQTEIGAQIKRMADAGLSDGAALRIDSHQHPHMIPVFFDAILGALIEQGFKAEYIRNSEDPISCYITAPSFYATYSPVNAIKCLLLNHYAGRLKRRLKKMGLKTNLLCGVFFSGNMDLPRVQKVFPHFVKKCGRRDSDLEILFHPGTMLESEFSEEFTKRGFNQFHVSPARGVEFKALADMEACLRN